MCGVGVYVCGCLMDVYVCGCVSVFCVFEYVKEVRGKIGRDAREDKWRKEERKDEREEEEERRRRGEGEEKRRGVMDQGERGEGEEERSGRSQGSGRERRQEMEKTYSKTVSFSFHSPLCLSLLCRMVSLAANSF